MESTLVCVARNSIDVLQRPYLRGEWNPWWIYWPRSDQKYWGSWSHKILWDQNNCEYTSEFGSFYFWSSNSPSWQWQLLAKNIFWESRYSLIAFLDFPDMGQQSLRPISQHHCHSQLMASCFSTGIKFWFKGCSIGLQVSFATGCHRTRQVLQRFCKFWQQRQPQSSWTEITESFHEEN